MHRQMAGELKQEFVVFDMSKIPPDPWSTRLIQKHQVE